MQTNLSGKKEKYANDEWKDMPEFIQENTEESFSKIVVRFRTEEDLQKFAELIGQKLTGKTKSIWYPYKSHWSESIMRWIDEP